MALQFHNKVTHTMYSPTWIINIRIVCAAKLKSIFPFINFIEDFRFIICFFVFFFQAKFSTHRQKDRFYTKQKIISHFFFLRALTFYFLINLFIAIQLFYIKRYHIFIRFSPSFCFISLFNKMIYPSTKASNLFLLPLRFCLLNIF